MQQKTARPERKIRSREAQLPKKKMSRRRIRLQILWILAGLI